MMLFDQVLAAPTDHLASSYQTEMRALQRAVREAEHFVVDATLARAADGLSKDEVVKAVPHCRVPFERTWIECVHAERPKFCAKPVAEGLIKPKRVGLLVERADDLETEGLYDLTLVWDCPGDYPVAACAVSAVANLSGSGLVPAEMNMLDAGLAGTQEGRQLPFVFTATRRYSGQSIAMINRHEPELCAQLLMSCIGDWGGEPWFWMGVLALLNAKNGAAVERGEDRTKLNRKRTQAGKPALQAFHVLTVRLSKGEQATAREGGTDHPGTRAHMVRGHFKVRSTGMYWWRPFVRGDLARGFAAKRYEMTR